VKFDGHAGGLISFRKPPTTTTKSIGAEVQISSPWEAEENFSERMAEASKVGEAMHRIVMGCCCGILGILLREKPTRRSIYSPVPCEALPIQGNQRRRRMESLAYEIVFSKIG